MLSFKNVASLQHYLDAERSKNRSIGFVPTMGALHDGHLSLILASKKENDITVTSIFVNPTQFNDPADLVKYPRTVEQDIEQLIGVGNDVLFLPEEEEIYPNGSEKQQLIDLNGLDKKMEGKFRDGHFDGVVQVVSRLLEIVEPHRLYMGQKDFQQFTIIGYYLEKTSSPVSLKVGPIVRESDGLAMSSRNRRLTPGFRTKATALHESLSMAKTLLGKKPLEVIKQNAMAHLKEQRLKPEYFELIDGKSLQEIDDEKDTDFIVACVAAWAGDVRLIDNLIIKGEKKLIS